MDKVIQKLENFFKDVGVEAKKIETAGPFVIAEIQKDLASYAQPLEAMLEAEFPGCAVPLAFTNALLQGSLTLASDAIDAAAKNGLNPTSDQVFILAVKALTALFKGKPASAPAPAKSTT
jgi:hypothetical protein